MKTIGILIPTYNEEDNVEQITAAIKVSLKLNWKNTITTLFSSTITQPTTPKINCGRCIAAINRSAVYSTLGTLARIGLIPRYFAVPGDAVLMCADFQDPPALIPNLVSNEVGKSCDGSKMSTDEGLIM